MRTDLKGDLSTSVEAPPAAAGERFCVACRQSLLGVTLRKCPECGRGYDPHDPRTTVGARRSVWEASENVAHAWVGLTVLLTVVAVAASATGHADPVMGLVLLVLVGGPLLVPTIVLASVPDVPMRPWVRVLGIGAVVVLVSVGLTHWPFVVTFNLHRGALDRAADRVMLRAMSGAGTGPGRIGILAIKRAQRYDANVGFQLTGGSGGGIYLARRGPGATRVWTNTNWEIPLGGEWYWVHED